MLRTNQNSCYLIIENNPIFLQKKLAFEFDKFTQDYNLVLISQDPRIRTSTAEYPKGTFCVANAKEARRVIDDNPQEIIKRIVAEILIAIDNKTLQQEYTNSRNSKVYFMRNYLGAKEFPFPVANDQWIVILSRGTFPLTSVEDLVEKLDMRALRNLYATKIDIIERRGSSANAVPTQTG